MESLKDKILTKLNDTSVDFSTRCSIAHGAFISYSSDFQLVNKEEIILEWIASNSTKSAKDYSSALQLLIKCLKSQQLSSFIKVVSPEPCLKFLKKANKYILDAELQTHVRDCTKLIMTLACFQLYFKNDVSALSKTVSIHYSAVTVCGHHGSDQCGACPELLLQLYNEIMLKDDFAIQFLDEIMPAIFSMPVSLCTCSTSKQMYKLMSQMFFKDARSIAEISSIDKYMTDPIFLSSARPAIQALVRTLTQSVITHNEDAMATFFSTFLSLFIKHTKTCVFKLFICLCSTLGFKSEQEGIKLGHKIDCKKSLKILLAMVNQLQISKVSLSVEESSQIFLDWISLLKLIMSPAYGISTYVLGIIQSVLNFAPLLFTHVLPQYVEYIMISLKDDNIRDLYALTLNSVMDVFQKLTRLSKLFDVIIETIVLQAKNNPIFLPPCKVMLPLEFKLNFEQLVGKMSSSQALKTITSLLVHLNREIAEPLSMPNTRIEVGQLVILEFITTLLECLLRNTNPFTPGHDSKYYHLLALMASILKRLGQAMLKQTFNEEFTNLYFKLSRVWGDCVLLIKNYDDSNSFENALMDQNVSSFQTISDSSAHNRWTDISYTYKFLNSEEWNFIGERVRNFASKDSTDDFCTMLIQNLNLLKLTDVLTTNKTEITISPLLGLANLKWLWSNCYQYISYIEEDTVLHLAMLLVDPEQSGNVSQFEKICTLHLLDNREGRMLSVLLGLGWLRQIGQVLNNLHMNKTEEMLAIIGTEECLVKAELVYGTPLDVDITNDDNDNDDDDDDDIIMYKMKVKNYGDEMPKQFILKLNNLSTVPEIGENDFKKIESFLDLIYALKITGLSPASCKLLLFGTLSVLYDISQQSRKPPQLLFTIISEILVKNIYLIGNLWLNNEFFQWLYNTYEGQPQKTVIFSLVCDFIVKKLNVSEFVESLTSNFELAPLLMTSLVKQQQSLKRKREESEEEIQQTRDNLKNCMKVVRKEIKSIIREKGVKEEQLHAFSLLLKHSVHTKSVKRIEWCSKHLQAFYDIALQKMLNPTTTDITNELHFMETVFSNWSMFRDKLAKDIHITLWKCLAMKENACSRSNSCMMLVLEVLSVEEYVNILDVMKLQMIDNRTLDNNFVSLEKAWKVMISAKVNAQKIKKRLSYKDFLESEISSLAAKWVTASPDIANVKAVFSILTAIVKTPTIRVGPENLDIMFMLMSALPPNDFEALLTGLNLLGNLLTKRTVVVLMHLPSFLQRYRFFITCVVEASSEDLNELKVSSVYECTNVIEKLALAMSTHKAEMTPNATNLVADIIHLFEVQTINPIIKRNLLNAVNALLTLCSQKSVDYLMQVLSPASREIFKNVYKNYNKYHRYQGKI